MKSTLDQLREWGKQAAKQAAELKRLHDYDTRLTAVMPADFKDWHENSRNEWPEIAAGVITSLRERENEAWKEVERLSALADNAGNKPPQVGLDCPVMQKNLTEKTND